MSRYQGENDVWFWDEQPIYEATARRNRAAYDRRVRPSDFDPDLRNMDTARRHRRPRRRQLSRRAVVAQPPPLVDPRSKRGRYG